MRMLANASTKANCSPSFMWFPTTITNIANTHANNVFRFSNVYSRRSISSTERSCSITKSKPMPLTASFICCKVMTEGSYSTNADREERETLADLTPSKVLSLFSTWAEQEEQAMPTTGIVTFKIETFNIQTINDT